MGKGRARLCRAVTFFPGNRVSARRSLALPLKTDAAFDLRNRLCLRVETEGFFPPGVQQKLDSLGQIEQTFILGFTLAIGPGNFQTGRPETGFVRLPLVNDRGELLPISILTSSHSEFKSYQLTPGIIRSILPECRSLGRPDFESSMSQQERLST